MPSYIFYEKLQITKVNIMSKRKTKHIIAAVHPDKSILAMNVFTNKFLWYRVNSKEIYSFLESGHGVEMDDVNPKSWVLKQINSGIRLIR
jgi:hypothetical protein